MFNSCVYIQMVKCQFQSILRRLLVEGPVLCVFATRFLWLTNVSLSTYLLLVSVNRASESDSINTLMVLLEMRHES